MRWKKGAKRYKSGRLKVSRSKAAIAERARVAEQTRLVSGLKMAHRREWPDPTDPRLESAVGRLCTKRGLPNTYLVAFTEYEKHYSLYAVALGAPHEAVGLERWTRKQGPGTGAGGDDMKDDDGGEWVCSIPGGLPIPAWQSKALDGFPDIKDGCVVPLSDEQLAKGLRKHGRPPRALVRPLVTQALIGAGAPRRMNAPPSNLSPCATRCAGAAAIWRSGRWRR